jgi:hypothetical protein
VGRLRIRAIRRLLGRGRLPVGGKLALATLVREHGDARRCSCRGAVTAGGLSQCDAAVGAAVVKTMSCGGAGDPLGRVRCHKRLAGGPQGRLQVREGDGRRAGSANWAMG